MQECYWKQKVLLETQSYRRQASGRVLSPYLMMDALYDKADRLDVFYDVAHLTPVLRNLRFQTSFTQVEHWMADGFRTTSGGAAEAFQNWAVGCRLETTGIP